MIFKIQVQNSIERLSINIDTIGWLFGLFVCLCVFLVDFVFSNMHSTHTHTHTNHQIHSVIIQIFHSHEQLFMSVGWFENWRFGSFLLLFDFHFTLLFSVSLYLLLSVCTDIYRKRPTDRPSICVTNCLWPSVLMRAERALFYCIAEHNYDNSLEEGVVFHWVSVLYRFGFGLFVLFSFVMCRADKIHFANFPNKKWKISCTEYSTRRFSENNEHIGTYTLWCVYNIHTYTGK